MPIPRAPRSACSGEPGAATLDVCRASSLACSTSAGFVVCPAPPVPATAHSSACLPLPDARRPPASIRPCLPTLTPPRPQPPTRPHPTLTPPHPRPHPTPTPPSPRSPEDSYSWIPGAAACLRCIRGVPEACRGGVCPSGTPEEFKAKSTPATSIVSVSKMGALGSNDVCDLAGEFEIPALTKCTSWKEDSPSLQLAFRVAGDCSIQISPITDPSCADPTDPRTSDVEGNDAYNADVHPYGESAHQPARLLGARLLHGKASIPTLLLCTLRCAATPPPPPPPKRQCSLRPRCAACPSLQARLRCAATTPGTQIPTSSPSARCLACRSTTTPPRTRECLGQPCSAARQPPPAGPLQSSHPSPGCCSR